MQKQSKTSCSRLTFEDRVIIETRYCMDRWSMTKIAQSLGKSTSSISREIAGKPRNGHKRYRAKTAEKRHRVRVGKQGRKRKIDETPELKEYVVNHMKLGWSPEQISIRLPLDFPEIESMRISYEAIYQYVYSQVYRNGHGYMKKNSIDLRPYLIRRHKRRVAKGFRKAKKQARTQSLPSIETRPKEVEQRVVVGHWEGDTLVSRSSPERVKSMNERVTGLVFFEKTRDGTSNACNGALIQRLHTIPTQYVKTLTQDRGTENMHYQDVEKALQVQCFFAHPYSSYERGSNENTNGLLRRFFPKKTNWSEVSNKQLQHAEYLINSRPRVRLKGLTPYEAFYQLTGVALDC
jgi:transposase, IS30 family